MSKQTDNHESAEGQGMDLVFHRDDMFYVVPYPAPPKGKTWEQVAADSAAANEGTTKVETLFGRVLWESPND